MATDGQDSLDGEVIKAAYLGSHMEYSIRTPAGVFFVVNADVAQPRIIGSKVKITVHPAGATLLPEADRGQVTVRPA